MIPLGDETPEGWVVTGYPWDKIDTPVLGAEQHVEQAVGLGLGQGADGGAGIDAAEGRELLGPTCRPGCWSRR
jgi:hypothetical protein